MDIRAGNNLLPVRLRRAQDHIRQSKESKLDELGRHSTKWTEKQQIQIRDMECMSVKYPPPPMSPITRKDVINNHHNDDADDDAGEEGSHTAIPSPGIDRYGFSDHVMLPPPMKMMSSSGGHHHGATGLQMSSPSQYDLKGSVANIQTNDYEVSRSVHTVTYGLPLAQLLLHHHYP